jgi:quercetin dioxygenase-like cupin family protein
MTLLRTYMASLMVVLCCFVTATGRPGSSRFNRPESQPATKMNTFTQALPPLNGEHVKVSVVEVTYAPGESSRPHTHPCPVIGYVVEGRVRMQVKGESEKTFAAGETFYEAPNGVHLISANAGGDRAVKFIAIFVCDHDTPLSLPVTGDAK